VRIGHIRIIQARIALRPFEARKKFFIIDNAHNLTAEASNALLKVLEEPPGDSHIILISSKPHLLFKTIVSRCRRIKFSALRRQSLEDILKGEYSLDADSAHFLAYSCEGRIAEALRLKDSRLLGEKNKIIDSFISPKGSGAFLPQDRKNMRVCLNILSGWLRDSFLLKGNVAPDELINRDRKDDLLKYSGDLSLSELQEAFKAVTDSFSYLEANANLKLLTANLKAQLWRR
ncbi:MAG: DNA polymerase III subunit delta' C-terminal domain-containing protein, partial [Candidatus Omnitrophota bacterium]|nr:DNA polymerase III subunit delta' C-terminal domain-containing protein [Candidatus Omnitrophota bacterium]